MANNIVTHAGNDYEGTINLLVWLDLSINTSPENLVTRRRLANVIHHIEVFDNITDGVEHIQSVSHEDRLALIVSGQAGQKIVPRIHGLQQVCVIYVYCMNRKYNRQWTKQFHKIQGVVTKSNDLIEKITQYQSKRMKSDADTYSAINIFDGEQGQSTTGPNGEFIYAQLLIDCLLRMQDDSDSKEALLSFCRERYKDNTRELAIIDEFQRTYTSSHAIEWYTKPSFLYRILNKALRLRSIELLYNLRSYIRDLYEQLTARQYPSPVRLYRGQLMSKMELAQLQNSRNKLIAMNSFLSTTRDRSLAVFYSQSSANLEPVVFEIDADPQLCEMKSFADISSCSQFPQEQEVLFNIGSVFRVLSVSEDDDGVWNIRLSLASGDDHDLKSVVDHMKIQQSQQHIGLLTFGHLLRDMGKYDLAQKYYLRLLDSLLPDSQERAQCYHALGVIGYENGDYDSSLEWHEKALELKATYVEWNDPQLVNNYISMGTIYARKKDYIQALKAFEKSLAILCQSGLNDSSKIAICYNNIAGIYQTQKRYSEALEYNRKALHIREQSLPADHPDLGVSYNNLGIVYRCSGSFELALENYQRALKIHQNSLPHQHPQIASTLNNTGLVYEDMGDLALADSYYKRAAMIYRQTVPETHPNRIKTEQFLQRVSMKRKSRSDSTDRHERIEIG